MLFQQLVLAHASVSEEASTQARLIRHEEAVQIEALMETYRQEQYISAGAATASLSSSRLV
jgi:hypothetical protein